jgi:hypothetical protein
MQVNVDLSGVNDGFARDLAEVKRKLAIGISANFKGKYRLNNEQINYDFKRDAEEVKFKLSRS